MSEQSVIEPTENKELDPETQAWEGGTEPMKISYGKMMMWYFLLSDAFTFSAFLITYGALRVSAAWWPDPNSVFNAFPFMGDAYVPMGFVSLMTFILILSSVFVVRAVQEGHRMNREGVMFWMSLGILGGIAFLACQAWEWNHLIHYGLTPSFNPFGSGSGGETINLAKYPDAFEMTEAGRVLKEGYSFGPKAFGALFFGITGFHGFHVLSGVIFNVWGFIKTADGTFHRRGHYEMIEKLGLYWHFVDLVWVFVFLAFYLL